MITRIGIFGTSGMAKEAGDIAHSLGLSYFYITQDKQQLSDEIVHENELETHQQGDTAFIIGIGDPIKRQHVYNRYSQRLNFTNLIHPSASFGMTQEQALDKAKAVIIAAGVRLTHNIKIGNGCIINLNATISHDCEIGDFTTISPQACLLGNIIIGKRSWIGANAVINQGKPQQKRKIGANVMIGAGAVVIKDCTKNSTYIGNPARKMS